MLPTRSHKQRLLIVQAAAWFQSGSCLINQAAAWFYFYGCLINQAAAWFWWGVKEVYIEHHLNLDFLQNFGYLPDQASKGSLWKVYRRPDSWWWPYGRVKKHPWVSNNKIESWTKSNNLERQSKTIILEFARRVSVINGIPRLRYLQLVSSDINSNGKETHNWVVYLVLV